MSNSRKNVRTPLKVRLRIDHPVHGELLVTTRDISECGVYVLIDQAQGLPMEAPILTLEVVRVEALGVGLRFVQTEE